MLSDLKSRVLALPACQEWPEFRSLMERPQPPSEFPFWKLPVVVARAAGCEAGAQACAASILCLAIGIQLVDDLLDGDSDGVSAGLSPGRAANFAAALHLIAAQAVQTSRQLDEPQRADALRWVGYAGIGTALGQDLEATSEEQDESTYWRVVEAKSQPLIRAGCALGGIAAGCDATTVEGLASIGGLLGQVIQLQDDLTDALDPAGRSDWLRPHQNLALLYALVADHPDRERFRLLVLGSLDGDRLAEAQLILTRSGAVAYCIYHVVERFRRMQAERLRLRSALARPDVLDEYLRAHVRSLEILLSELGVESPEDIWTP